VDGLHFLGRIDGRPGDDGLGQELAAEDHATRSVREILTPEAPFPDRFEVEDLQ
jgi:hypothetical protein